MSIAIGRRRLVFGFRVERVTQDPEALARRYEIQRARDAAIAQKSGWESIHLLSRGPHL